MKKIIIHLTDGSEICLTYAEGSRFHDDLENGRLVSYGRFIAKNPKEYGFMEQMHWNHNGELTYVFRRIRKDGHLTHNYFSMSADEIPSNYKASGLRVEVKP